MICDEKNKMASAKNNNALILLHPADNVLVCIRQIRQGDSLVIDGAEVISADLIQVGHKVARSDLLADNKIYKYGAAIGSLLTNVRRGEHVHMHNMQSDYIPSHTRTRQNSQRSES
jgi:(2R)-sulfolactate sulfo-lyase subunit alpha